MIDKTSNVQSNQAESKASLIGTDPGDTGPRPQPSKGSGSARNLRHGGETADFARETGKDAQDILDFSSNINPLGVSPKIKKVYEESFNCISEYPDSYAREFCRAAARHLSVEAGNVLAGNGAVSLIDLTIRSLRPKRALLVEPCFNEYRRLLHLVGAQVRQLLLKEEDSFRFSYEDIIQRLDGMDMVVLGYPNNPTGTALKRQEMVALVRETKRRGTFLLVDEAFIDWDPGRSIYQEIKHSSSLAVIRSLTKFFALAGIRSGFVLAAPKVIAGMRSVQEPWSCNALAQKLSIAALEDKGFQERSLQWFQEESKHFYQRLSQCPKIKAFPSLANFFLLKLNDSENRDRFSNFIRSQGIYLREMDDIGGLNNRYFRVALKSRRQNLFLIEKLKEALAGQHSPAMTYREG
jgi:threonine-phosphate decarboxylase